jgi:hypothetical protein
MVVKVRVIEWRDAFGNLVQGKEILTGFCLVESDIHTFKKPLLFLSRSVEGVCACVGNGFEYVRIGVKE